VRELQVLGNGHLKLDFADWKEFFETEMVEQLRSQLKALIEQALEAERDYYLQLNYCEHAPKCRLDGESCWGKARRSLGMLRRAPDFRWLPWPLFIFLFFDRSRRW
jgi:hypothetical protein